MFAQVEHASDFATLQALTQETDNILFSFRQKPHPAGINYTHWR